MNQRQRGFTLVELIIVIIVIGVLAAILVAVWNGVTASARDNARSADVQTWATSFDTYKGRYGVWPALPTDSSTPLSACLGSFTSTSSKCGQYTNASASIDATQSASTSIVTNIAKTGTAVSDSSQAVVSSAIGPFVYLWQTAPAGDGSITVTGAFMNIFENASCPNGFQTSAAIVATNTTNYSGLSTLLTGLNPAAHACGVVKSFTYTPAS